MYQSQERERQTHNINVKYIGYFSIKNNIKKKHTGKEKTFTLQVVSI